MILHPFPVGIHQRILILLQQHIPPSVLDPGPAILNWIEERGARRQLQHDGTHSFKQLMRLTAVSRVLIHHNDNSMQAPLLIQIGKVIMHSCITGGLAFGGYIISEELIFIADCSHHSYSTSSRRWNCDSYIVVLRLPDAAPRLPQVSGCLVEVHDLAPFSVVLCALVNEADSFHEYLLGGMPAG